MLIKTRQIKGEGRGRELGFPTVNMVIPTDITLDEGIYIGWFTVNDRPYKSAIHFGPIPVFDDNQMSLEAHLVDVSDESIPDISDLDIEVDIVQKIRDIESFHNVEDLILQIEKDVNKARAMLK